MKEKEQETEQEKDNEDEKEKKVEDEKEQEKEKGQEQEKEQEKEKEQEAEKEQEKESEKALPTNKRMLRGISLQDQQFLDDHNSEMVRRMADKARVEIKDMLNKLRSAELYTFIKLFNPVPKGHSVHFGIVSGERSAVESAAKEFGLTIEGDSIHAAQADSVEVNPEENDDKFINTTSTDLDINDGGSQVVYKDVIERHLSKGEKMDVDGINEHAYNALSTEFCKALHPFIDALEKHGIFVRMINPIPKGHIVNYELVAGSRAVLKKVGAESGLTVTDNRIELTSENSVSAEAETVDGFEAVTNIPGAGEVLK